MMCRRRRCGCGCGWRGEKPAEAWAEFIHGSSRIPLLPVKPPERKIDHHTNQGATQPNDYIRDRGSLRYGEDPLPHHLRRSQKRSRVGHRRRLRRVPRAGPSGSPLEDGARALRGEGAGAAGGGQVERHRAGGVFQARRDAAAGGPGPRSRVRGRREVGLGVCTTRGLPLQGVERATRPRLVRKKRKTTQLHQVRRALVLPRETGGELTTPGEPCPPIGPSNVDNCHA